MDQDAQLAKITSEYLDAFFGFALNKTGNVTLAEELAQEIAYQCIIAICKGKVIRNFNAYVWSIAYNTFKRGCSRERLSSLDEKPETLTNILSLDIPLTEQIVCEEQTNAVRFALSQLVSDYRKTIVLFYYDELPIRAIGQRLSISDGMVKFYLKAGKRKLKEVFDMNPIGEKSFNPSEFTVYKSAIELSKVNVWEVFKRKLPCQIALICYDSAKTISVIALETGTPAAYIEDEVQLLCEAGVMVSLAKDKYRTNLCVMKKDASAQVRRQFSDLYSDYVPSVLAVYTRYLPQLKECDVFRFDATRCQWAWFFAQSIAEFDHSGYSLSDGDYPRILSCGSRGFIFAEESQSSPWVMGVTPTELGRCTVFPCDVAVLGEYHRQKELYDERKAQALYDIYCGILKEDEIETYAELLNQGYVVKKNNVLYCNVAVSTEKSRHLFTAINVELSTKLSPLCKEIRGNIARLIKTTIPEQLHPYTKGYTQTWILFYAGICLREALYNNGFLTVPAVGDSTPVACWVYEK
ncbi:MAG: sigma-70 family RNA polymerase sigma factor [Anaerolineae bacterium]